MTPNEAKRFTAKALEEYGQPAYRLSARTINFQDLARGSCVFVKVHDWAPNAIATELETIARANGFRIEF